MEEEEEWTRVRVLHQSMDYLQS